MNSSESYNIQQLALKQFNDPRISLFVSPVCDDYNVSMRYTVKDFPKNFLYSIRKPLASLGVDLHDSAAVADAIVTEFNAIRPTSVACTDVCMYVMYRPCGAPQPA